MRSEASILKDSARFSKADLKTSTVQISTALLLLGLVLAAMHFTPFHLNFVFYPLFTGLIVRIFIFQHDCVHDSFFRKKRSNVILGNLISCITGIPFGSFKEVHRWHHRDHGKIDKESPDLPQTVGEATKDLRKARIMSFMMSPPIFLIFGPMLLILLTKTSYGVYKNEGIARRNLKNTLLVDLGHLAFLLSIVLLLGPLKGLISIAVSYYLANTVAMYLFYIQHHYEHTYYATSKDWSFVQTAVQGSSYINFNRVFRWFTANIGIHHVHHLNPSIPNYNLEAARKGVPELAAVAPLSTRQLLTSFNLIFWDEEEMKMVGIAEVQRRCELSKSAQISPPEVL